jgi:hypothetical protein
VVYAPGTTDQDQKKQNRALQDHAGKIATNTAAIAKQAAQAWAYFTVSGGTYTNAASFNIASFVKNATGQVTVTFTTPFKSANYAVVATTLGGDFLAFVGTPATGTVDLNFRNASTTAAVDPAGFSVVMFGTQ